jgi:periplasmic protein TonB
LPRQPGFTKAATLSATHYLPPSAQGRTPPGRRALSFLLALAIEVLLLLAFLTLNFREKEIPQFEGGRLTTFDVSEAATQDRSRSVQKQVAAEKLPPRPAPPIPRPTIELPERPLQMIEVTRQEFLDSDISKLGTAGAGRQSGPQLAGGSAAGDSAKVGTAPNGEPLYAAEWYREPTRIELGAYLPKRMPEGGGWGMVACRTAPRWRVEDCVELGQGPAGSHLASAVRQAAWQFMVRPPRVGGKPMIGEWVRIRIDYMVERSNSTASLDRDRSYDR